MFLFHNNHQNSKVVYRRARTSRTQWRQMNNWKMLNNKIISQRRHNSKSIFEMFIQWSSPWVKQSLAMYTWLEGKNQWETNVTCKRASSDVERISVSVVFTIILWSFITQHMLRISLNKVYGMSLSNGFWGSWCNNCVDITVII